MSRITFGFTIELLSKMPEFSSRMAEIELLLRADAAKYKGAMPEDTVTEAGTGAPRVVAGTIGTQVFNYTPVFQGELSRKILQKEGSQTLENGSQTYMWFDDDLMMVETLRSGKTDRQKFRKATESLYIATTIENWYQTPARVLTLVLPFAVWQHL
jgi:hypothetical protein